MKILSRSALTGIIWAIYCILALPSFAQVRKVESLVYSEIVDRMWDEMPKKVPIVVSGKTTALSYTLLGTNAKEIAKLVPAATESVIFDFLGVGERQDEILISDLYPRSTKKLIVLSPMRYRKIFSSSVELDERWRNFERQFPKSLGLITFSRVGLDFANKQALVLMVTSSGGRFEAGTLVLLIRKHGGWKISDRTDVWIT